MYPTTIQVCNFLFYDFTISLPISLLLDTATYPFGHGLRQRTGQSSKSPYLAAETPAPRSASLRANGPKRIVLISARVRQMRVTYACALRRAFIGSSEPSALSHHARRDGLERTQIHPPLYSPRGSYGLASSFPTFRFAFVYLLYSSFFGQRTIVTTELFSKEYHKGLQTYLPAHCDASAC